MFKSEPKFKTVQYFNILDLADFLMHHWFPVSFFDAAALGVC